MPSCCWHLHEGTDALMLLILRLICSWLATLQQQLQQPSKVKSMQLHVQQQHKSMSLTSSSNRSSSEQRQDAWTERWVRAWDIWEAPVLSVLSLHGTDGDSGSEP